MSDRRRVNRVQGNWSASPGTTANNVTMGKEPNSRKSTSVFANPPSWMEHINKSSLPKSDRFFYEPQEDDLKEKQELIFIEKSGVYDLSTEPSGLSRIRLTTDFLETRHADDLFEYLYNELPWRQMTGYHNGYKYLQPRLNAFYSDVDYYYSGTLHHATPQWPECLVDLKEMLEANTGLVFNGVLANLYRDEHDSVAWHADDEPELGPDPTVVSVSLGTTRNFYLRKNPTDPTDADYTYSQHYKIPLPHASLLIMEGSTQTDWQHCVPKEYHSRSPRINLTFRAFINDVQKHNAVK